MKKILKWSFSLFYMVAGVNHFLNPQFYYGLIPNYLPFPECINYLSGVAELIFGFFAIFAKTEKIGGVGILLLLILFIPAHVYFIQIGSCINGGLCVAQWIGWVRLVVIHPLLLIWAWQITGLKRL